MLREKIVFGPIRSRRLGSSLGINLLPERGKLCNFDCIYCECGWNRDGRGDRTLPDADTLFLALEARLRHCAEEGTPIDSITFSGDGEPTLNPDFPAIVDGTLALRDRYYPDARVSVLTNATRLDIPEVFAALNSLGTFQNFGTRMYYSNVVTAGHGKASDCVKCGGCEDICPQHLPIRAHLEKAAAAFDK